MINLINASKVLHGLKLELDTAPLANIAQGLGDINGQVLQTLRERLENIEQGGEGGDTDAALSKMQELVQQVDGPLGEQLQSTLDELRDGLERTDGDPAEVTAEQAGIDVDALGRSLNGLEAGTGQLGMLGRVQEMMRDGEAGAISEDDGWFMPIDNAAEARADAPDTPDAPDAADAADSAREGASLQESMQRMQEMNGMMKNVLERMHETSTDVIENLRGEADLPEDFDQTVALAVEGEGPEDEAGDEAVEVAEASAGAQTAADLDAYVAQMAAEGEGEDAYEIAEADGGELANADVEAAVADDHDEPEDEDTDGTRYDDTTA